MDCSNLTRQIPLTQGYSATVDRWDYWRLINHNWHADIQVLKNGNLIIYAVRKTPAENGKRQRLQMHREILAPPDDLLVDHKDKNGLNNTRQNLRAVTARENNYNMDRAPNKHGFTGVSFDSSRCRWRTVIKLPNGQRKFLGRFKTPEEASKRYQEAVSLYHVIS